MKTALVFGTFDILHPGHLYFLKKAKQHGDTLAAVIALDETVKQVKGHAPLNNQKRRMENLMKTGLLDSVVLGNPGDKHKVVEDIKPDVICLGYDQKFFTENLKESLAKRGIKAKIVRIDAYMPERYKSSKLRDSKKKK